MSYDLRLGVKVDDTDIIAVIAEPLFSSPTYNLRGMFVACMNWNYTQGEWYKVSEVWDKIKTGIKELSEHPEKYEQYNPENGWGDIHSALNALRSLDECIKQNTPGEDNWSWNEIPVEHLYMSW